MQTLKFDMSDPATKAAVAGWEPNTQYTVETGEDPASGVVMEAGVEEAEPEEEEPAESPGPAAVKAAMGSGGSTPMNGGMAGMMSKK